MLNATLAVHLKNGFWNTKGGYEFLLLMSGAAVGVAAAGPGDASLDNALGFMDALSGVVWAPIVIAVAVVISTVTMTVGRHQEQLPRHPVR